MGTALAADLSAAVPVLAPKVLQDLGPELCIASSADVTQLPRSFYDGRVVRHCHVFLATADAAAAANEALRREQPTPTALRHAVRPAVGVVHGACHTHTSSVQHLCWLQVLQQRPLLVAPQQQITAELQQRCSHWLCPEQATVLCQKTCIA